MARLFDSYVTGCIASVQGTGTDSTYVRHRQSMVSSLIIMGGA